MPNDASDNSAKIEADQHTSKTRTLVAAWFHRLIILFSAWLLLVGLPSIKSVRSVMMRPLYVHQPNAQGDCAYVMADGYAYYERLRAASDLYHMHRIEKIYISDEQQSSGYHFELGRSISVADKARMVLGMWGVPESVISTIPVDDSGLFSSSGEAHSFAETVVLKERVVVVTSAPHTRRSRLCFQRVLSADQVAIFSASEPADSAELSPPIWLEYFKLGLYYLLA